MRFRVYGSVQVFKKVWRTWVLGVALLLAHAAGIAATTAVSLPDARKEFEAGKAVLIDIREPFEHATGVVKGAVLLPLSQLRSGAATFPGASNKPVILICNSQNRSKALAQALEENGMRNIRYVEGGMSGWNQLGWPTIKP